MVCVVPNKQIMNRTVYKNRCITIIEKYRINGFSFGLHTKTARFSKRVVYFYNIPICFYNKIVQIL